MRSRSIERPEYSPVLLPLVFWQRCSIMASGNFKMKLSMSEEFSGGPPSPEEFQRQLSDFVRQHFQSGRGAASAQPEGAGGPGSTEASQKPDPFDFKQKPRDVKDYLDRFVIKHDEAKKDISV